MSVAHPGKRPEMPPHSTEPHLTGPPTTSSTAPEPPAYPRGAALGSRHPWLTTRTAFLGALTLLLVGYVVLALRMEFRTPAGRIGAGFFPQVVGISALVLCLLALFRKPTGASDGPEDAGHTNPQKAGPYETGPTKSGSLETSSLETGPSEARSHYTGTLIISVVAAVGFFVLLRPLGAVVAASAYLLGMLALLNRGRVVTNIAVGVGLPTGLYVLFDIVLGASLPSGVF